MSFEGASHAVEALPERPGLPSAGRVPGEGDRILHELRVKAAAEGLRIHKADEDY